MIGCGDEKFAITVHRTWVTPQMKAVSWCPIIWQMAQIVDPSHHIGNFSLLTPSGSPQKCPPVGTFASVLFFRLAVLFFCQWTRKYCFMHFAVKIDLKDV